jgi:hypothetical protein
MEKPSLLSRWRRLEWTLEPEYTDNGDIWRGYRSTGVPKYRSTEVQMYRCTDVQTNVAIERMVAVGLTKKGTHSCTIENSVKNRWADAGGGGMVESRSPNHHHQLWKRLKSKGWLITRRILTFWGYAEFFRGSLCTLLWHVNMYIITVIQLWCIRYFVHIMVA